MHRTSSPNLFYLPYASIAGNAAAWPDKAKRTVGGVCRVIKGQRLEWEPQPVKEQGGSEGRLKKEGTRKKGNTLNMKGGGENKLRHEKKEERERGHEGSIDGEGGEGETWQLGNGEGSAARLDPDSLHLSRPDGLSCSCVPPPPHSPPIPPHTHTHTALCNVYMVVKTTYT